MRQLYKSNFSLLNYTKYALMTNIHQDLAVKSHDIFPLQDIKTGWQDVVSFSKLVLFIFTDPKPVITVVVLVFIAIFLLLINVAAVVCHRKRRKRKSKSAF